MPLWCRCATSVCSCCLLRAPPAWWSLSIAHAAAAPPRARRSSRHHCSCARTHTHTHTQGVRIKDVGAKLGLLGLDNGRIWFDSVRIPRTHMLDRYAKVCAHVCGVERGQVDDDRASVHLPPLPLSPTLSPPSPHLFAHTPVTGGARRHLQERAERRAALRHASRCPAHCAPGGGCVGRLLRSRRSLHGAAVCLSTQPVWTGAETAGERAGDVCNPSLQGRGVCVCAFDGTRTSRSHRRRRTQSLKEEVLIIQYLSHQRRLLPLLAKTCV